MLYSYSKLFTFILLEVLFVLAGCTSNGRQLEPFASCLTEKGAVMYGAFWCAHCQEQKKLFGDSFQYINYVECSLPDGKTQTELCLKKNISGYPTWEFEDSRRVEGSMDLETLAQRTGCSLPTNNSPN